MLKKKKKKALLGCPRSREMVKGDGSFFQISQHLFLQDKAGPEHTDLSFPRSGGAAVPSHLFLPPVLKHAVPSVLQEKVIPITSLK